MKINKPYLEQLILEQVELMENIEHSNFSVPLAKAGELLVGIMNWYYLLFKDRRANPITVSMNDFDSILNPYLNKWISLSLDGDQFCGQLDSFDVAASAFPRLLLHFKNFAYAAGGNEEDYINSVTLSMSPRGTDPKNGYIAILPVAVLSPSSSIIIGKDGSSDTDLTASDQANFKFMEELGTNPSINAGIRFLRDLVAGDGGSEVTTLHPTQVLGIKSVFPKEKSDIILRTLEEYIERGDLSVELPEYD